ncbi:hypothetical protein PoB_003501200 [Plakobranchus ocellatus]|uniref:Uncharacterized protein n=1 Tax=Plakobranchus ocellatus TaxID=259542 RepID=A0AAV4ANJ9_9GAST|nr:hypothetical protein PoB_003501200 [Plakobranchus ocellatus]
MVREEKVWCCVLCIEKVGRKEGEERVEILGGRLPIASQPIIYITNAHGPSPRSATFFLMSGRDSHVNGTKARKVRIASKSHPRPAIPTVPPIPDPSRRHRRARQDKVVTAIRTFKDTARPIQPFPRCHPFEQRIGKLCSVCPLPPSGILETDSAPVRREKNRKEAPPSGEKNNCHRQAKEKKRNNR